MAKKDYSEDLLIQAPTAEFLERELGWQSVLAYDDEDFGPDSLLGRQNDAEVVLTREVLAALKRLNPTAASARMRTSPSRRRISHGCRCCSKACWTASGCWTSSRTSSCSMLPRGRRSRSCRATTSSWA
jgi:hypothetical protein